MIDFQKSIKSLTFLRNAILGRWVSKHVIYVLFFGFGGYRLNFGNCTRKPLPSRTALATTAPRRLFRMLACPIRFLAKGPTLRKKSDTQTVYKAAMSRKSRRDTASKNTKKERKIRMIGVSRVHKLQQATTA